MPDITTGSNIPILPVIMSYLNSVNNTLCSRNLIRTHNHQHILRSKNTILRKNVKDCMLRKKGLCKVDQIWNNTIVGIRPEGCKFKAVACLLFLCLPRICILDGIKPGTVRVVLRIRSIGNDKYLYILKQTAASPERISLIAVNLIKRFTNRNTTSLQLYVYKRKSIDKNRHIVSVIVLCSPIRSHNILIDDLKPVVMNICLVNQGDVLCHRIITFKDLNIILLDLSCFLDYMLIRVCNGIGEKPFPLIITELIII